MQRMNMQNMKKHTTMHRCMTMHPARPALLNMQWCGRDVRRLIISWFTDVDLYARVRME